MILNKTDLVAPDASDRAPRRDRGAAAPGGASSSSARDGRVPPQVALGLGAGGRGRSRRPPLGARARSRARPRRFRELCRDRGPVADGDAFLARLRAAIAPARRAAGQGFCRCARPRPAAGRPGGRRPGAAVFRPALARRREARDAARRDRPQRPRPRRHHRRRWAAECTSSRRARDDRRRFGRGRSRPDPGRHRACCRAPTPRSRCSPRHRSGAARRTRPRRACASRRSCGSATISRSTSTWRRSPSARLVVARLLGGSAYWPYGVERLVETCRARGIPLALLPGDDKPDPELAELSTLPPEPGPPAVALSRRGRPRQCRQFAALRRIADRLRAAMGGARAAAARRALLARSRPAEPRRHRRASGAGRRRRADRVLPGAGAVGEHRAGRCAGRGARRRGGCARCRSSCRASRTARRRADRRAASPQLRRR